MRWVSRGWGRDGWEWIPGEWGDVSSLLFAFFLCYILTFEPQILFRFNSEEYYSWFLHEPLHVPSNRRSAWRQKTFSASNRKIFFGVGRGIGDCSMKHIFGLMLCLYARDFFNNCIDITTIFFEDYHTIPLDSCFSPQLPATHPLKLKLLQEWSGPSK